MFEILFFVLVQSPPTTCTLPETAGLGAEDRTTNRCHWSIFIVDVAVSPRADRARDRNRLTQAIHAFNNPQENYIQSTSPILVFVSDCLS